MKAAEIREMSVKDIQEKLSEERAALNKLKFSHAISSLESPVEIGKRRKVIARLLTELKVRVDNTQK